MKAHAQILRDELFIQSLILLLLLFSFFMINKSGWEMK